MHRLESKYTVIVYPCMIRDKRKMGSNGLIKSMDSSLTVALEKLSALRADSIAIVFFTGCFV